MPLGLSMLHNTHKSVTQSLADSWIAQRIFVVLRLPQLVNWLLEKLPIHGRFGELRLQYRIRRMESLIVVDEVFKTKIYEPTIHPGTERIMDIGCNIGFFSLYCAEALGRTDIKGIAIDANPEMAKEARWHLQKNGLDKIEVIYGLAGAPKEQKEGTFFISNSNIASSVLSHPNPNLPAKGELKAVKTPAINLAKEWKKRFGDERIDILKIDVEGYEAELIKNSPELLALADVIAIDIHKWVVTPQEVEGLLAENHFELFAAEGDSMHCVVDFFRRKK